MTAKTDNSELHVGRAGEDESAAFLERRVATILARPTRTARGVVWLAVTGLAYGAAIAVLAWGGDRPADFAPWLAIPASSYFWWEALFIGPAIVGCGLLAAAVTHLMARAAGGSGTFDDTLALIGPAVAFGTVFTLVPDLLIGALLVTGVLDQDVWLSGVTRPGLILALVWTYLLLYLAALLVAFPVAVAAAHRLSWGRALLVGAAGVVVYQGVLFIFIR